MVGDLPSPLLMLVFLGVQFAEGFTVIRFEIYECGKMEVADGSIE
jgi:hypothetical protein